MNVPEVEAFPAELVRTQIVADLAFVSVEVDTFRDGEGLEFERVNIRHPGAVGIVPVDGDHVIMLKQFRAPLRAMILEIPAGKLDVDDAEPISAAARECEEETGFRPGRLEFLRTIHTAVGFSNERIDLFLATDLVEVGARPEGVEEIHAEILRMSFQDVATAIEDGSITDAKTLIGLTDVLSRFG